MTKGNVMKQRFILFRRSGVFYYEDTTTGKQLSLRTKDEAEAKILLGQERIIPAIRPQSPDCPDVSCRHRFKNGDPHMANANACKSHQLVVSGGVCLGEKRNRQGKYES